MLPVIAQPASGSEATAAVRILQIPRVTPPHAVAQLVAIEHGTIGNLAGSGGAGRDPVVGAVCRQVAVALQPRTCAASVVRERRRRRTAIADTELQRMITTELVRGKVGGVS